jgi:plastocyanin
MNTRYLLTLCIVSQALIAGATTFPFTTVGTMFSPTNHANVQVGDTISFTGSGSHNVYSTSLPAGVDSIIIDPLSSTAFLFIPEVPGTYNFECTNHFGMTGSFTVDTPASITSTLAYQQLEYSAGVNSDRQGFVKIFNPTATDVQIQIMDITGKSVANVYNGPLGTGETVLKADMSAFNTGIYFVRMERAGKVYTKKVLLR